jgi:hypothetical protein
MIARRWPVLVALLLAAIPRGGAADEVIDRVLAVVSGQVITLSDVTAARDLGLVPAGESADPIRTVLDRLIDRQLVLQEVDRYAPPEPAAEAVARELARVRSVFPSERAFDQALARSGIDERHLRQRLRDDLRIAAYLDLRFVVAPPSEEDVRGYVREHADRFVGDGRPLPDAVAAPQAASALAAERRRMLIDDWVAGLRRRAVITNVYSAVQ